MFKNEPLLELRREAVRREALQALEALDAKLPLEVPMLIGEDVVRGRVFASVDPSAPTRIVANAHEATAAHVSDAVGRAEQGHRSWSRKPAADRAAALQRAAGILRSRRLELAALAVREAGKPWAEADADVCEAIATFPGGVASMRRRVSCSKLRSHARRSVKTGGAQPFCAAWTTSWSQ